MTRAIIICPAKNNYMRLSMLAEDIMRDQLYDFYAYQMVNKFKSDPYYKHIVDVLYVDYMQKFKDCIAARADDHEWSSDNGKWKSELPKAYEKIKALPKDIAIDKINALTHHNGPLIDYFEPWMADALDEICAAKTPKAYWGKLSSHGRRALSMWVSPSDPVSVMEKIAVRLRRLSDGNGVKIDSVNSNEITGTHEDPYYYYAGNIIHAYKTKPLPFRIFYKDKRLYLTHYFVPLFAHEVDVEPHEKTVLVKMSWKDAVDREAINVMSYFANNYNMMSKQNTTNASPPIDRSIKVRQIGPDGTEINAD